VLPTARHLLSYMQCSMSASVYSVAVLPRATVLAEEYIGRFRSASVYRVLQCCHEQHYWLKNIQGVPGVPLYTECFNIAKGNNHELYTVCSRSASVYRVLQCFQNKTVC
jgi:hypothetical protein